jgi:hypothetical protein
MADLIRTLDPAKGIVTVGGVPLSGFSADKSIEIEYNEESFTETVGCDGATARVRNFNENGKATIYLLQTSPSNLYLSGLAAKDRLDNSGVIPFVFTDLSGSTIATAAQSYILKVPKYTHGKTVQEEPWVLSLVGLKLVIGGN